MQAERDSTRKKRSYKPPFTMMNHRKGETSNRSTLVVSDQLYQFLSSAFQEFNPVKSTLIWALGGYSGVNSVHIVKESSYGNRRSS